MLSDKVKWHITLTSCFQGRSLYHDEPTQNKLNIRKLDELHWQLRYL
jgi:hypothetical protein